MYTELHGIHYTFSNFLNVFQAINTYMYEMKNFEKNRKQ